MFSFTSELLASLSLSCTRTQLVIVSSFCLPGMVCCMTVRYAETILLRNVFGWKIVLPITVTREMRASSNHIFVIAALVFGEKMSKGATCPLCQCAHTVWCTVFSCQLMGMRESIVMICQFYLLFFCFLPQFQPLLLYDFFSDASFSFICDHSSIAFTAKSNLN